MGGSIEPKECRKGRVPRLGARQQAWHSHWELSLPSPCFSSHLSWFGTGFWRLGGVWLWVCVFSAHLSACHWVCCFSEKQAPRALSLQPKPLDLWDHVEFYLFVYLFIYLCIYLFIYLFLSFPCFCPAGLQGGDPTRPPSEARAYSWFNIPQTTSLVFLAGRRGVWPCSPLSQATPDGLEGHGLFYIYLFILCVCLCEEEDVCHFLTALECCVPFCTAQPPQGPFQAQWEFFRIGERNP